MNRLELKTDSNGRLFVESTSTGCGCCSYDDKYFRRGEALAELADVEDQLKARLKELRAMRRKVLKFQE